MDVRELDFELPPARIAAAAETAEVMREGVGAAGGGGGGGGGAERAGARGPLPPPPPLP